MHGSSVDGPASVGAANRLGGRQQVAVALEDRGNIARGNADLCGGVAESSLGGVEDIQHISADGPETPVFSAYFESKRCVRPAPARTEQTLRDNGGGIRGQRLPQLTGQVHAESSHRRPSVVDLGPTFDGLRSNASGFVMQPHRSGHFVSVLPARA